MSGRATFAFSTRSLLLFVAVACVEIGTDPEEPAAIELSALQHALVFINGGQRGLQVKLAPDDARTALEARAVSLLAE